ncbi:hypothetical protein [Clostridium sp. KNHs216]|uniref:hypothetical protein n=1 Tax=Clostridium sp. KNHs216 TaxID=1550235 RepID=UPI00114DF0FB|nr:hypothetical protein [Clostridium sp. KNHs216]TQI66256.1 A118 family predicted phage portal protein [Clostridium sp. KNHs216]
MGLINWIKGMLRRMFTPEEVYQIFNVQPAASSVMMGAVESWKDIYEGRACWLADDPEMRSAQFAAIVSSEAARLATIELSFEITGSARADYLQQRMSILQDKIRTQLEYACALGGMVLKPNGDGVDFIKQGEFIPVDLDSNGDITGAIFPSAKQLGNQYFTRFEYQRFENGVYKISNKAFVSDSPETIGRPVALAAVREWANIQPEVSIDNLERPLFAYLKMPWANQVDSSSPLGCSIFSKAIDTIQDIDFTARGLRHEIKTADRKVFVSDKILRRDDKGRVIRNPIPDLIEGLEYNIDEKSTYHEFNPEIRIEQYRQSMQTFLNIAGNQCGFSNGYFSFDEKTGMVTATQVEADQQRTISTATDIQKALKTALSGLAYGLDAYASLYNLAPAGAYEENYSMRDLSVNVTEDRARAWQMVLQGKVPFYWYAMNYESMSKDEARKLYREAQEESAARGLNLDDREGEE